MYHDIPGGPQSSRIRLEEVVCHSKDRAEEIVAFFEIQAQEAKEGEIRLRDHRVLSALRLFV
jgi:hypothetical protein